MLQWQIVIRLIFHQHFVSPNKELKCVVCKQVMIVSNEIFEVYNG